MIIAIAAYLLVSFAERGDISMRESQLLNAFGYKFASAPNIAYKGGAGFTYDVAVPKMLDGRPYNVTYVCRDIGSGEGSCFAQIDWMGTYGPLNYPYVVAPAHYVVGSGSGACLDHTGEINAYSISFYPEQSDGHLIFRNIGVQAGEQYPTIEMHCEVAS